LPLLFLLSALHMAKRDRIRIIKVPITNDNKKKAKRAEELYKKVVLESHKYDGFQLGAYLREIENSRLHDLYGVLFFDCFLESEIPFTARQATMFMEADRFKGIPSDTKSKLGAEKTSLLTGLPPEHYMKFAEIAKNTSLGRCRRMASAIRKNPNHAEMILADFDRYLSDMKKWDESRNSRSNYNYDVAQISFEAELAQRKIKEAKEIIRAIPKRGRGLIIPLIMDTMNDMKNIIEELKK